MAKLSLEVEGLQKTLKQFDKFGVEGEKMIEDVTEAAAQQIERDAKDIHKPNIDTGDLHKNIKAEPLTKFIWFITSYMHYSKYLEFGTVKSRAYPFLYPAWRKGAKLYVRSLKQGLKALTNKFNKS